jgi:hypothetical protein
MSNGNGNPKENGDYYSEDNRAARLARYREQGLTPEAAKSRARIAYDMRIRGYGMDAIQSRLETEGFGRISISSISGMISKMDSVVHQQLVRRGKTEIGRQYEALKAIHAEAMMGWEQSKRGSRLARERKTPRQPGPPDANGRVRDPGHATEVVHEVREAAGDPRFLVTAMRALEGIRKLLNIDGVNKFQFVNKPSAPSVPKVEVPAEDAVATALAGSDAISEDELRLVSDVLGRLERLQGGK